jgi:ABC-type nitrate/sulfonate/bicarbonate transport system permease component
MPAKEGVFMPKKSVSITIIGLFYISLLILWQVLSQLFPDLAHLFPSLSAIGRTLIQNGFSLAQATLYTGYQASLGLLLSAVVAVGLSWFMHRFMLVRRLIYPLCVLQQVTPVLAIAPLIILWFGFGITSHVVLVVFACFFPILVAFLQALDKMDLDLLHLLKSYGANSWQLFKYVRWPLGLVGFFAGFKTSATYAVGVAVTAEWLGGQHGLGNLLLRSRKSYDYPRLVAVVAVIVGLGLLFVGISWGMERWVLRHYRMNKIEQI